MEYFDVLERSKFGIKVRWCPDAENLSNNFITEEQYEALGGHANARTMRFFRSYEGRNSDLPHPETLKDLPTINAILTSWIDLIKEGRNSTTATTPEIEELKEHVELWEINNILNNHPANNGQVYYAVNDEKIYNKHAKIKHKDTRSDRILVRDYKNLSRLVQRCIQQKYRVTVPFDSYPDNKQAEFTFAKKLITWKDIKQDLEHGKNSWCFRPKAIKRIDIPYIKNLWDDPSKMDQFTGMVQLKP